MHTFRISRDAGSDLDNINDYTLENFGEHKAAETFERIRRAIGAICRHPEISHTFERTSESTRRYLVEYHAIYYQVREDEIHILRVLGPGQDPFQHL